MGNISPFTEHGLEILPLIFSVFCELLPFHIQQNNFIKLFGSIRFNPLPFEIISRITIHLSHVPSQLPGKRNAVDIRQIKIHQCGSKRFAILQRLYRVRGISYRNDLRPTAVQHLNGNPLG